MTDEYIARWADLLAAYCLEVQPGETVLIGSPLAAQSLVAACYRAVLLRGGYPLVRLELPGLFEFFLEHANRDQLAHCPPTALFEAEHCDGRIRISAQTDTRSMSHIQPHRQAAHDRALQPVRSAARQKRWVLTQYPTEAYAADAGMSLAEFESFVKTAMFLDQPDPAACWHAARDRQQHVIDRLSTVDRIHIEAEGTDLELSVNGRTWINSDGKRNMPSGEVFTGPIENSARGRLRCGFPVCRDGRELVGVALEFDAGRVVSSHADQGENYLNAMLDLDQGSRLLGELGIGLNERIQRFTGSILYDEKIGGTVHLALGQSYAETGGVNESTLHWDLIVDLRTNGRIRADGVTVMENGKWLVG